MHTTSSVTTFDTVYPADSVEYCPCPGYKDYFVCGTYKLEEEKHKEPGDSDRYETDRSDGELVPKTTSTTQTRLGKCWLMRVESSGEFKPVQRFDLPAVLDLKWSYSWVESPRLAIADALGCLSFYDLKGQVPAADDTICVLAPRQKLQCTSNICLSLDWSDRLRPDSGDGQVVTSVSDGSLAVATQANGVYEVTREWHAHEYEPWIAAWNYWEREIVYSGGDDLTWKGWDLRTDLLSPIFANKRSFEGGVTTIQTHPHRQHYVAVGSYDEHVRIFDIRQPLVPMSTVHVGGGAWRVKWHPFPQREQDLLVACMHDGFKVIHLSPEVFGQIGDASQTTVLTSFNEHESLAYGVDWSASDNLNGFPSQSLVASGSFYDHTLKSWFA